MSILHDVNEMGGPWTKFAKVDLVFCVFEIQHMSPYYKSDYRNCGSWKSEKLTGCSSLNHCCSSNYIVRLLNSRLNYIICIFPSLLDIQPVYKTLNSFIEHHASALSTKIFAAIRWICEHTKTRTFMSYVDFCRIFSLEALEWLVDFSYIFGKISIPIGETFCICLSERVNIIVVSNFFLRTYMPSVFFCLGEEQDVSSCQIWCPLNQKTLTCRLNSLKIFLRANSSEIWHE